MRHNWKFHVIAVSVISGLILLLYVFIGPGANKQVLVQQAPSRVIKFYSGTWGRNCDPFIAKENDRLLQLKLHPDQLAKLDPADRPQSLDPLPRVQKDNVLPVVAELCNGKEDCNIEATSTILKNEPFSSCYKHLEVSFRCFEFDRLHNLEVNQNDTLHMDCHAPASEPAAK